MWSLAQTTQPVTSNSLWSLPLELLQESSDEEDTTQTGVVECHTEVEVEKVKVEKVKEEKVKLEKVKVERAPVRGRPPTVKVENAPPWKRVRGSVAQVTGASSSSGQSATSDPYC